MGTLKLGARNGAIVSLVADPNSLSNAVITLPKAAGELATTEQIDELIDLDLEEIRDLAQTIQQIQTDYLSKEEGGIVRDLVTINKPEQDVTYSGFTLMGRIGGATGKTLLKDYHFASGDPQTDDAVQYFGAQISDFSIMNQLQTYIHYLIIQII